MIMVQDDARDDKDLVSYKTTTTSVPVPIVRSVCAVRAIVRDAAYAAGLSTMYLLFGTRNVHGVNIRIFLVAWCNGAELHPDTYNEPTSH
jgi:hypothetical protein